MKNFNKFILYIIQLKKEISTQDGRLTNTGIFPITLDFLLNNKDIFQEILSEDFGKENDIINSILVGYNYTTQDFSFDCSEEYISVMSKILEVEKSIHVFRDNYYFFEFITLAKLYYSKYGQFIKPVLYPIFMVEQFKNRDVEEGKNIYNDFITELSEYKIIERTSFTLEKIKERS